MAELTRLALRFTRSHPGGGGVEAVADLPLRGGPIIVLFGPSGAGKTTVLRCLAGLERPDSGAIHFAGETWVDRDRGLDLPPERRGVGFVFQEQVLFPHLSVGANIGYGLFRRRRAERDARVREMAAICGVEPLLGRRPHQLSGGERQRVALARALAPQPRLLLLDEPLSALDAAAREALRQELRGLLAAAGVPAILVTHDRSEAMALGDLVAVLVAGQLRQVGTVPEVFGAPADEQVARAVGTENVLPARRIGARDGLCTVSVGTAELTAIDPVGGGEGRSGAEGGWLACVRAEEVVLEPEPERGAPTSARNRLPATVQWVRIEGPLARVRLDCGFPLTALVTRRSAEELGLAPGSHVTALVKAPAVRLVPRS